jgi:hypothetical protein
VQDVRYFALFCDLEWPHISGWEEERREEGDVHALADCVERVDAPRIPLADLHHFAKRATSGDFGRSNESIVRD